MAQPVGRVIEPLKPQGSRMQMRYLEDDFGLSYTQPSEFGLDVEQLYWSPFNDETVQYDVFDRFTMELGHARVRPDERWLLVFDMPMGDPPPPPTAFCTMDCASMNSALSLTFSENVLQGTSMVPVFEDRVYTINPNEAFRDDDQVKYVPFPKFDRSYTWRDSRLVTVDETGQVLGLGGAQNPGGNPPNNDTTVRTSIRRGSAMLRIRSSCSSAVASGFRTMPTSSASTSATTTRSRCRCWSTSRCSLTIRPMARRRPSTASRSRCSVLRRARSR